MALPSIAPGDLLAVTVKGRLFQQRTNNTFHYLIDTAVAQNLGNFASQFTADFDPVWANAVSEDWTADTLVIRRISPNSTRGIEFGLDWVGQVESPALPPSTAAVISRYSYSGGPSNRGRVFIAGVATSHHLEGSLTNPGLALFSLLAAQIDDNVVDGVALIAKPVLFHRADATNSNIDVAQARSILRQQRRREIGVGE